MLMKYRKPNWFCYRIAQIVSWFVAAVLFRRKILRNEIKGVKGPFVVIANHEAALDFVNLIGTTYRRMTFVISKSLRQKSMCAILFNVTILLMKVMTRS